MRGLLVTLFVIASASWAWADPPAFVAALPADWSAVLVVAEPIVTVDQIRDDARLMDMAVPAPFVAALEQLAEIDGIDMQGRFVLGCCRPAAAEPELFLLVPTTDHDILIAELNGDPALDRPLIDLGGQPLTALRRGGWLLIAADGLTQRVSEAATTPAAGIDWQAETAPVQFAINPSGWSCLTDLIAKSTRDNNDWYRSARGVVTSNAWLPSTLPQARDTLLALAPAVDVMQQSQTTMHLALETRNAEYLIKLRLIRDASTNETSANNKPTGYRSIPLGDGKMEKAIVTAAGTLSDDWKQLLLDGWIAAYRITSDDRSLAMDGSSYLDDFRERAKATAALVKDFAFESALPGEGAPPMANQAVRLRCASSQALVDSLSATFEAWNVLSARSPVREKFVFERKDVTVAGLAGVRFSVDLQKAFAAEDVAEVKTLMVALFGPPGELAYTVLPLDEQTLFVSQWPDDVTAQMVAVRQSATGVTPQPAAELRAGDVQAEFAPYHYQQWIALQYAIEFAGMKHAPTARQLNDHSHLSIALTSKPRELQASLTVPRGVLREWLGDKAATK